MGPSPRHHNGAVVSSSPIGPSGSASSLSIRSTPTPMFTMDCRMVSRIRPRSIEGNRQPIVTQFAPALLGEHTSLDRAMGLTHWFAPGVADRCGPRLHPAGKGHRGSPDPRPPVARICPPPTQVLPPEEPRNPIFASLVVRSAPARVVPPRPSDPSVAPATSPLDRFGLTPVPRLRHAPPAVIGCLVLRRARASQVEASRNPVGKR